MLTPMVQLRQLERCDGPETSRLTNYLPAIYASSPFIQEFLRLMDSFWLPLERKIDRMYTLFDPRLAPFEFLPWLSTWVDLVLDENLSEHQVRTLVHRAADLYRRRGTPGGLRDYLTICTGVVPEIIEDGSPENPFHFTVRIVSSERASIRDRVVRIIEEEKPAHTNYTLVME